MREYQERDRARLETDPEYRARVRAQQGRQRQRDAEKISARSKLYYAENSAAVKARTRAWVAANPERVREYNRDYNREYARANPDRIRKYTAATASRQDPARLAEANRKWHLENREYVTSKKRAQRIEKDRVVNPQAVNQGARWNKAQTKIALDLSLTCVEAALQLGRTRSAIANRRHLARKGTA
jgi:hypothetical protein